jgi:riboflavin kinase/FMN adenylyltransferase
VRILNTYEQAAEKKAYCVALGSFDGVHVGHQKLIQVLKNNSDLFGCSSMVYTFEKHPRKILKPDKPIYMITSNVQRAKIIESLQVEALFLESFEKIMNMSAEQFFHDILIEKFHAKCIVVGYNYHFGRHSEGNSEILVQLGYKYGVKVEVVSPVLVENQVVSSSLIRHKIHDGKVDEVLNYLDRAYSLQSSVIHGKKNGKAMGIRTANLEIGKEAIVPKKGVYISDTVIEERSYKSVTNVGVNPTFQGNALSIETHVLDFEGDLYNQPIEVYFLKRMRDEISFRSVNELVQQIHSDIAERLNYSGL